MKKWMTVLAVLMLSALSLPCSNAYAVTDGFYNMSTASASPTWDGTDANRQKAATSENTSTYGDESTVTYQLPWPISFYGQLYRSINVDTNGNIWFGTPGPAHSFTLANGHGPVIAAWNNDLSSYYYGGAFVQHKTDPERVVVEWQTETYTEEGFRRPNTFKVILYPDGGIRFDYSSFSTTTAKDFGSGTSKGDGTALLSLTSRYGKATTFAGRSFILTGIPKISTDPVQTFDSYLCAPSPYTVTVTNSREGKLVLGAITLDDATRQFGIASNGCSGKTLLPFETCSVQLSFLPTSFGQKTAQLHIASNDPGTPTLNVSVIGNVDQCPVRRVSGGATTAYVSLQTAYNAAASGDTIQCLGRELTESVTFNQAKDLTLIGGFDRDFAVNPGITRLYGGMSVTAGQVAAQNFSLEASMGDATSPTTTASPKGGLYTPIMVSLTCNDGTGAGCSKIFYSLHTTPTPTAFSEYTGWITVGANTNLSYFGTDLAGNLENYKTEAYTIDTVVPTGTVVISGGAAYTTSQNVSLSLTCSDANGCSQMMFSNDNSHWSAPVPFASTTTWSLTTGDGTKTVYVRFMDTPGNWSAVYSDSIVLDTTPPTGTIVINGGATAITSNAATLTLTCSDANGCAYMQFSNDKASWSTAEPYATTKAWTMTTGTGTKTVYVKFQDRAGIWAASEAYDTIVVDTTPAAYPVRVINAGGVNYFSTYQAAYNGAVEGDTIQSKSVEFGETVLLAQTKTVNLVGGFTADYGASVGATRINGGMTVGSGSVGAERISLGASIAGDVTPPTTSANPPGGFYNAAQTVALTCGDGTGSGCDKIYYTLDSAAPPSAFLVYSAPLAITATTTVRYFATDLAGNSESYKSQNYVIDTVPPTGTVIINNGAAATSSTSVNLAVTCNDANGCSYMQFSNDNTSTWSQLYPFAATMSWTLSQGDGTKTVYARLTDMAGNVSTVAIADTIKLDTTPPTGTVTINGGAAATNSAALTLTLTCSDANGCSQMQFSNDNATWSAAEPYAATKAWTAASGDGTKTVYVKLIDSSGFYPAVVTQTVVLDTTTASATTYPVRISNAITNYYTSLQTAYNAASNGDTIQCQTADLTENLTLNSAKTVTIFGGYSPGFTSSPGITTVHGDANISGGSVTAKNLTVKY